ncbi:MAG: hypothetical protein JXA54_12190 [Candidatus Heimdallarchaeota archaeon]|nr:hypothetical protein [Candidatus Heimdallarchaeota archaeon]
MAEINNTKTEAVDFESHPEVVSLRNQLAGMSKDLLKKTSDKLRTDISQISSKIDLLKKKREECNSEARHYKNMRNNVTDEKYSEISKMREEAEREKELRDNCNEQIKINKAKRDELKESLREAWTKVKELRDKYYQMKDEVGVLPEDITNEIRELEWKQQTTTLDPEDDVFLTKRITELYEKAYTAHLIGFSSEELNTSIEKAKQLSTEHEEAHQNVIQYHEHGQKHHQRMQFLYEQIDERRSGGSDLHEKYVALREEANLAHEKIVVLYDTIKLNQFMMDLIDDEQTRRRHEKTQQIQEEKKEETIKKQASNKRLTLEELRLLMGDGEEDEEE